MHRIEDVDWALSLIEEGLNDCQVSRETGVPRRTIQGWRHGLVPRRAQVARDRVSCESCGHPLHRADRLPAPEYSYLLGMYLGDGCISEMRRKVFSLRITLDRRYPGIVSECASAMAAVMPTSKVNVLKHRREKMDVVVSYSRAWPCLFPQHGPGMKHTRAIELADWQQGITAEYPRPLVRGLIHSDGWRGTNVIRHPKKTYRYPRYQFCNHSDDIRQIFCDHLNLIGVDWRVMNRWNISVARREAVARMDEFIGPKR